MRYRPRGIWKIIAYYSLFQRIIASESPAKIGPAFTEISLNKQTDRQTDRQAKIVQNVILVSYMYRVKAIILILQSDS